MHLKTAVVSSQLFTHNPTAKTYTAEISDLGGLGMQRLYDDSADMGITVSYGGLETRWKFFHAVHDKRENELLEWVLIPTPETLADNPRLQGYKMVLFND
jgi:hypothetical protein